MKKPNIITLSGKKIARISTVAFFIETQLKDQIIYLSKVGADITVIASEPNLSQPIDGVNYKSIEIPRKISFFKDLIALVRLFLYFRSSKFDIIHSTTPKAGLLCAIAGFLARTPVRIHTYTGQPWISLSGLKFHLSRLSDVVISILSTHCYADSNSQRIFLIDSKVCPDDKISVIGSGSLAGVNVDRFDSRSISDYDIFETKTRLSIPDNAFVFLFVGRLNVDKGLNELVTAFKILIDNDSKSNVRLVLLGPVEPDAVEILSNIPSALSERVVVAGFSASPEIYMAFADVLILPSYREGFGTVVIEAAAMSVPTIGTDIYGLSDAIVNKKTGLLVPVKSSEELSIAMDYMIKNDKERIEMGINAQNRARSEFSSIVFSNLLVEEYIFLLNKKSDSKIYS